MQGNNQRLILYGHFEHIKWTGFKKDAKKMRGSGTLPHHLFGNTPDPGSMFADFRVLPVLLQLWTHFEQSAVPLKLLFGQRALPH